MQYLSWIPCAQKLLHVIICSLLGYVMIVVFNSKNTLKVGALIDDIVLGSLLKDLLSMCLASCHGTFL